MKDREEYISILEQDNAELKKQLNELQKPQIFIDTQDMEERYGEELYQTYLEEEVKKLKKQLEEANRFKFTYNNDKTKIPTKIYNVNTIKDIEKLKKQQQEFIKYLEDEKFLYKINTQGYSMDIVKKILQKYKEIIGDLDEK